MTNVSPAQANESVLARTNRQMNERFMATADGDNLASVSINPSRNMSGWNESAHRLQENISWASGNGNTPTDMFNSHFSIKAGGGYSDNAVTDFPALPLNPAFLNSGDANSILTQTAVVLQKSALDVWQNSIVPNKLNQSSSNFSNRMVLRDTAGQNFQNALHIFRRSHGFSDWSTSSEGSRMSSESGNIENIKRGSQESLSLAQVVTIREKSPLHSSIIEMTEWDGVVEAIEGDQLSCKLLRLDEENDADDDMYGTIPKDCVDPKDYDLLFPGSIFRLSVGVEVRDGRRQQFLRLAFTRLPDWDQSAMDEAYDRIDKLFGRINIVR